MRTVVALTLLLAGCLGQAPVEESGPAAAIDVERPTHATQTFEGVVVASAQTSQGYLLPSKSYPVEVPENATAMVIELLWDDPRFDLDVSHYAPSGRISHDGGMPGMGDTPLKVVLLRPELESGAQSFRIGAKGAANTPYTLHVTVFTGGVPAEDFTAASGSARKEA